MSKISDKIRVEWKANDAKRDAGLTTPENIIRYDNLVYGKDAKWNVLDIYRPKNKDGLLPVIINVHGGGWVYGDKELYQFYGMSLAQRGFAVINFTYRLAPEYKFPAQVEDINSVVEWMYENAQEYELNLNYVFMVGDSAGAHLSSLYSNICTNKEFAKKFEINVPDQFRPTALGLNCGDYDPLGEHEDNKDIVELMKDLLAGGGTSEEAELMNIYDNVTSEFPPVYLMSAYGDFCLNHTKIMDNVLSKNNIRHVFKIYGLEEQPLYHVFHVNMKEKAGKQCNDEECQFFMGFLIHS